MSFRLNQLPKGKQSGIVMFELHMDYPTHIAYGEIAIYFKTHGCKLVGYKPILDLNIRGLSGLVAQKLFRVDKGQSWPFYIFRSIGIKSFVIPFIPMRLRFVALRKVRQIKLNTKDDVLNLNILGVHIGDLFYDWHMNIRQLGTIDLNSKYFHRDLVRFLQTLYFWNDYFDKNDVKAVLVSHTCYGQGILTRIAIKNQVASLQITGDRMYRMGTDQPYADSEYEFYDPKIEDLFDYQISIDRAKLYISELRTGKIGVDASHARVSGYKGFESTQIIDSSEKQKILIVSHCFSDSPNGFGIQLFPDYFVWLQEALIASSDINADWYIRPHPGFVHHDLVIFNELLAGFPHVKNVGIDISIPALIRQGITTVLTSHGTVGFEAALEGAYVLGASQHAFYKNYNFVNIPKTRSDWHIAVSELDQPKKSEYNNDEIYHYYDIHHLRSESSWLLREKYPDFLQIVGGLREQFTNPRAFGAWLSLSSGDDDLITNQELLMNFLESKSYFYKYGSRL